MKLIPIATLVVPDNRQRQEFEPGALMELMQSIQERGLMHPVVVRETAEGPTLVAGERRLRAIRDLWALGGQFLCNAALVPEGYLPVVTLGELAPLDAEEAELDENLKRRDLTWQEHAAAVSRLDALRKVQAKPIEGGHFDGLMPATTTQVAAELKQPFDKTRAEILIASHLGNPLIANAGSAKEALKILKSQETQRQHAALAVEVGKTFGVESHTLFNADCLTKMAELRELGVNSDFFDVICTDPPYGMGADEFGDGGGKMTGITHVYKDDYESWKKLLSAWCPLSFAVTKPEAHAYVFCDFDKFHVLKGMMQAAGWYVFRTPLIVHKQNSGRVPLPDRGPRRQYELILYAIKGNKPVNHIYSDVISVAADENLTHGAQKPVALMQNLLMRSVKPGDKVFDPFCGTGPTFAAGHAMRCYVTGIELSQEYYGLSVARLRDLKRLEQPALFP